MNYGNELNKLLREEKSITNRMYLNEILLQYRRFEYALEKNHSEEGYYEMIANAMTVFSSHLDNPKYSYNKTSKNGFKKSSPIMSSSYIDEFINSLMKNQRILKNKGVSWGKQSFSMKMRLSPKNLSDFDKDISFTFKESPSFIQLTQKLDFQFRVSGKKAFSKYEVVLPLMLFIIHKKLHTDDMIRIGYYAEKVKLSLSKSKVIIICETLDSSFTKEDIPPGIDVIFVLRKKRSGKKNDVIYADVIKALCEKIESYLYDSGEEVLDFENVGYIE